MAKKEDIRFYEINPKYIDYLLPYAPHLYTNKQPGQNHERKYIGVVLRVNDMDYFAPLSSAKKKHKYIEEGLDFIKVKNLHFLSRNAKNICYNNCSPNSILRNHSSNAFLLKSILQSRDW